eukprot:SAG25_NODE_64_length_17680_cov_5.716398_14_plen_122_part_00
MRTISSRSGGTALNNTRRGGTGVVWWHQEVRKATSPYSCKLVQNYPYGSMLWSVSVTVDSVTVDSAPSAVRQKPQQENSAGRFGWRKVSFCPASQMKGKRRVGLNWMIDYQRLAGSAGLAG